MDTAQLQSAEIGAFAKALADAQGELTNIGFDAANPHFKSRYATLAAVLSAIRPILSKHKLAFSQLPTTNADGSVTLYTQLTHESGQWQRCDFPVKGARGNGPQDMGSALTYARRYCACAIVGVAGEEDDDGNAAQDDYRTGRQDTSNKPQTKAQKWEQLSKPALSQSTREALNAFAKHHITREQLESRQRKFASEFDENDIAELEEIYHELRNGKPTEDFFPAPKQASKPADRINEKFGAQAEKQTA